MNRKKGLQRREAGYVRKRRKQSGWRVREREREKKVKGSLGFMNESF